MFILPEELDLHIHIASLGGIIGTIIAILFFVFSFVMLIVNNQDRLPLRYLTLELVFIPLLLGYAIYRSSHDIPTILLWAKISLSAVAFVPVAFRLIIDWILRNDNLIRVIHFSLLSMIWVGLIWIEPEWMCLESVWQNQSSGFPFHIRGWGYWLFIFMNLGLLGFDWGRFIYNSRLNNKIRSGTLSLIFGSTIWLWLSFYDGITLLGLIPNFDPVIWVGPSVMLFLMGVYYAQSLRHQSINLERLAEEKDRFYQQLIHDDLTGVYSRSYFNSVLKQGFEENQRYKVNHSILFIDVDDFKMINDELGHQTGDRLLVNLSRILKGTTRSSDLVARYGGDEFVILLINCEIDKAVGFAKRIVKNYQVMLESYFKNTPINKVLPGISIGISHTDFWDGQMESILNQADYAMYEAKRQGKNRISVFMTVDPSGNFQVKTID